MQVLLKNENMLKRYTKMHVAYIGHVLSEPWADTNAVPELSQ